MRNSNKVRAKPLNIFITDDDEDEIFFLREAVSELSVACNVTSFLNGRDLLDSLKHNGQLPDMIILDLNMPVVDGAHTLSFLKSNLYLKDLPVFIFSTSRNVDDIVRCVKLGCEAYYMKPLNLSEYNSILEDMISRLD